MSNDVSPDFATLFLIKQLLADKLNATFQSQYITETKRIKSDIQRGNWSDIVRPGLRAYKLLFVPGFRYISEPTSGADFNNQRQFFSELGVKVQLVRTEEEGTVEANAAIIAASIRAEREANLILVSTSKAGPEVALALGRLLMPRETCPVKAWISVGGLIYGTPLVDYATSWPESWIVRLMFLYARTSYRSLPGLTTVASRARMNTIRIPRDIMIVQYMAVPLSGDIYGPVTNRYRRLRKDGPNDGLTPLADELLPNGITVIEPGLDHFYADPDIEAKSVALANVTSETLAAQRRIEK